MLDMFFVHAEMRPPVTPTNWQAPSSVAQLFTDVGWGLALEPTAFIALQDKPLGMPDTGRFTAAPNSVQPQRATPTVTTAATTTGADTNAAAPALQTEVQRIAEQRMLLLAQRYAMRDDLRPKARRRSWPG